MTKVKPLEKSWQIHPTDRWWSLKQSGKIWSLNSRIVLLLSARMVLFSDWIDTGSFRTNKNRRLWRSVFQFLGKGVSLAWFLSRNHASVHKIFIGLGFSAKFSTRICPLRAWILVLLARHIHQYYIYKDQCICHYLPGIPDSIANSCQESQIVKSARGKTNGVKGENRDFKKLFFGKIEKPISISGRFFLWYCTGK